MTATAARVFPGVLAGVRRRLRPLGLRRLPLAPDLAMPAGRVDLRAARWRVGGVGELRTVRVLGPTCEVVSVLLFPADPERVPVFAAELLAFGGKPRLIFLDLQGPGLDPAVTERVGVTCRRLAERYAHLPADPHPPGWAVAGTCGGPLFVRPTVDQAAAVRRAAGDYLRAWVRASARGGGSAEPLARLTAYKRDHLAHSPARPFLVTVFGADWADRFLGTFLYR